MVGAEIGWFSAEVGGLGLAAEGLENGTCGGGGGG